MVWEGSEAAENECEQCGKLPVSFVSVDIIRSRRRVRAILSNGMSGLTGVSSFGSGSSGGLLFMQNSARAAASQILNRKSLYVTH